ncbi:MAG: 3-deoxy-D-manno-octulosonic acid transferase, partial [Cyclobacteriaceae bacterium]|nr:3-deoxy-D-manno-octulosonic acid transferase [Cyclobacteriaceae bacterium]
TGDTRYDRTKAIAQSPKSFPELRDFVWKKNIITVGSAWQEDMDLLIPLINESDKFKWIIAPHDIEPDKIAEWKSKINKSSQKYSELPLKPETEVLFIDNIGSLSSLYQFAKIAYVGGAFGKGLHNILEPIAYGIPVIFGKVKKSGKFPEAQISQEYGCGYSVENEQQLKNIVLELSEDAHYLNSCQNAVRLVNDNIGSASKIMDIISSKIQQS